MNLLIVHAIAHTKVADFNSFAKRVNNFTQLK